MPWHQRLGQITKPYEFQQMLLDDAIRDGHRMVQIGKDIGFADAYMPATGEAVKTVFAGEAGTDPIIKQSSIPSMGGCAGMKVCIAAGEQPAAARAVCCRNRHCMCIKLHSRFTCCGRASLATCQLQSNGARA